ncbi:MAG: carboxypeptidase-like regulatory domain-containing protein [Gemmatimonadaceae bacterium]|nr:carboxypeptidase-like regulatory domain-containing protein [Gemmatimonadaceae bacterium]
MTTSRFRWLSGLLGAAVLSAVPLRAQSPATALPETAPGVLAGIVVDSANVPIRNIAVYLYERREQVRTGPDGRFRFTGVEKGTYTLSARSVGFIGVTERLKVPAKGAVVRLKLTQLERGLPAVITTASRGGLAGIVADTALRALDGASVKLMGTSYAAKTDSAGRFYFAAKPGSYLLRIERSGYARQLVGVTVPPNEGREVAVWLTEGPTRENPVVGANLFDFEQRHIRARQVTYQFFSRDDLAATGANDVMQAAARTTVTPTNFEACAYLDGGPAVAPLWSIAVGEVEFMEALVPGPRGVPGDILNKPTGARATCSYNVWLRR